MSSPDPAAQRRSTSGDQWRVVGPQPLGSFVADGVNDQLVQLSVQLAAELWVTRRRLAMIESQLVGAGLISSPDQRPPSDEPEDHSERDEFVGRIFSGFLT